jgi:hypothetical protein
MAPKARAREKVQCAVRPQARTGVRLAVPRLPHGADRQSLAAARPQPPQEVARAASLAAAERGLAPVDDALVDAFVDFWGAALSSDGRRAKLGSTDDDACRSHNALRHTMKVCCARQTRDRA